MATTNINFKTMSDETINMFSMFNIALQSLRALREQYKADCAKIEQDRNKIIEDRNNAIDNGLNADDAYRKYSLVEVDKAQNRLDLQYEKDCEPFKKSKKTAMDMLDDNLYLGYLLAQNNGSLASKGSVTVKKGKKVEKYELDKSYVAMIKDFLAKIGAQHADNDKAVNKVANIIAVRTSGMIKANKGTDYIKVKSSTQYKELALCVLLQYLVIDKAVLVQADDFSLSKNA